jgi:hypothetical protein
MTTKSIFDAAVALPETERMELVTRLLETLGPETDGIDDAQLLADLQQRSAEIDNGTAELIPWSELKNELY